MLVNSILVAGVCLVVLGLLFLLNRRKQGNVTAQQKDNGITHHCPVCGSGLKRGERVYSEAISLKSEKIMYIHGCPQCSGTRAGVKRICPVCRNALGQEDYLVGKMWEEPGRKRLHVAGCNSCTGFPKHR